MLFCPICAEGETSAVKAARTGVASLQFTNAGQVSGDISVPRTTTRAGRPGCPHRPPIGGAKPPSGFNMLRLQSPLPDRYTSATPEELVDWIGAARAELGDRVFILGHHYQRDEVSARGPMPGATLWVVSAGPAAARGRLHRVLRRPLHGRVGRRAHADHQQVILPDLNAGCSMAGHGDLEEVED